MTTGMKKAIRVSILCLTMFLLTTGVSFADNWEIIRDNNNGKVWNQNPQPGETVTWGGSYDDNGFATGWGVLQWYQYGNPQAMYEGEMQNGKRHGQGRITWINGNVYDGAWENGYRTGWGTYTWPDGHVFEGNWVKNSREGYGKITKPNGEYYAGGWKNDRRNDDEFIYSPIPKSIGDYVYKTYYEGGFWGHGYVTVSGWVESVSNNRIQIRLDSSADITVGGVNYHYGAVIWDDYDRWHYKW
jgi:hypothetical protein